MDANIFDKGETMKDIMDSLKNEYQQKKKCWEEQHPGDVVIDIEGRWYLMVDGSIDSEMGYSYSAERIQREKDILLHISDKSIVSYPSFARDFICIYLRSLASMGYKTFEILTHYPIPE